jgi:hypothetical protein
VEVGRYDDLNVRESNAGVFDLMETRLGTYLDWLELEGARDEKEKVYLAQFRALDEVGLSI